ncbi:hypothetical protein PoB_006317500 [Plakobranchus ocellatus]|uniref:Uncharacterized protein n=1 Tax=Plakobranchus ocellatus TaxID=259542 RepID=A0AAV4CXR8_9GAST|nr:hypothetical protein PoB_006317500 [Plakobranchus ocellatus]
MQLLSFRSPVRGHHRVHSVLPFNKSGTHKIPKFDLMYTYTTWLQTEPQSLYCAFRYWVDDGTGTGRFIWSFCIANDLSFSSSPSDQDASGEAQTRDSGVPAVSFICSKDSLKKSTHTL